MVVIPRIVLAFVVVAAIAGTVGGSTAVAVQAVLGAVILFLAGVALYAHIRGE